MANKNKNLPSKIPEILVNVERRGNVKVIDFQKHPNADPMKVYINQSGDIQVVQVSNFGVDTVKFSIKSLVVLLKSLGVNWDEDFSGNFTLQPKKWSKGEKV